MLIIIIIRDGKKEIKRRRGKMAERERKWEWEWKMKDRDREGEGKGRREREGGRGSLGGRLSPSLCCMKPHRCPSLQARKR